MEEDIKPTLWRKIKDFIRESKRVLIVTKKPTKDEFKTIVKVSGLGIIIIGVIGFIIQMIKQFMF
jgi:protein transport protein SEC61 subunit gamma-like protein